MTAELNFKPSDVDLSNDLCSTFGKSEIEYAASISSSILSKVAMNGISSMTDCTGITLITS